MYAEAYRRGYGRVVAFMDGRDPDTPVPATPEWTALDVLRHLTGLAVDVTNSVFDGFGSDEWTSEHVKSRWRMSLDEVVAEWDDAVGAAAEIFDRISEIGLPDTISSALGAIDIEAIPAMAVSDILQHEFDLRNAFGDSGGRDLLDIHFAAAGHVKSLRRTFEAAGLPTIRVESTDSGMGWDIGYDEPVALLRAASFDLMRAIGGRRTKGELRGLEWDVDPEPLLDSMVLPHLRMRETSLRE